MFSCKIKTQLTHQTLFFNNSRVYSVDFHKQHHIKKINKTKRTVGLIKKCKIVHCQQKFWVEWLVLSSFSFWLLWYDVSYPTTIDPDYGSSLHHVIKRVEQIECHASLAGTGAWQETVRWKLLDWKSISGRHLCRHVLQIHKIMKQLLGYTIWHLSCRNCTEDTSQFSFHCPIFSTIRVSLVNAVNTITQHNII